jgi:hypothetical protein
MKSLSVIALALLVSIAASYSSATAQEEPKVPLLSMTAEQLKQSGIALGSLGVSALPNSCASIGSADISLSNELVAAFEGRGFTLESICLGLVGTFAFDPESGKPLPFAVLPDDGRIKLNLPNCFRRAVPLLDCAYRYEHNWGVKQNAEEQGLDRQVGEEINKIALANITPSRIVHPYDDFDEPSNVFKDRSILLHLVVFSNKLPLGYGYAFQGPEGDDPEEESVDLETYRKETGAFSLWSD